jgi:16S rRNA (cytidine1402-2'-O)-methyltransferase
VAVAAAPQRPSAAAQDWAGAGQAAARSGRNRPRQLSQAGSQSRKLACAIGIFELAWERPAVARHRKKSRTFSSVANPSLPRSDHAPYNADSVSKSGGDRKVGGSGGKSHSMEAPAGRKEGDIVSTDALAPGLYVTATPIGNAADITLRALNVLKNCDAIVAEDTRVTSRLLSVYGISRPLLIYNDHNARSMRPKLLQRLRGGARLAFVSDAGTPLVSDPGYRLVREVRDEGLPVFPVPGASAVLAALTAAGLPSDRFFFVGFLSAKAGVRREALTSLRAIPATLIFFESAGRLSDTLSDMTEIFGNREAAVARELTKIHEEVRRGSLADLAAEFSALPPRGEIVLLVAPSPAEAAPDQALIDALLKQALPFMPIKPAAALVAQATGIGRRVVYRRALALKAQSGADG